jgi:hypothetical protein
MVTTDDYVAEFPTAQSVIDQLTAIGIKTQQDAAQASKDDALAILMAQAIDIPGLNPGSSAADARAFAGMMVGMDQNAQGRPWNVFKDSSGAWKYFYTKEAWDRPTTAAQAREIIAGLEADFPSDDYDWVVGDKDSDTGVYDIIASKVGQGVAKTLDPNNPLMMGDDGTPTTIELGNGQKMGFLSDGRSFTVDPAEVADTEIDWSTLQSSDVKIVTAKGQDFAVFPDGTKYQVGEKFAGGINPSDVEVVNQVPLKDGTFAAIFNNGQIFRTGREIKPATVGYQSDVGKFQVTQPDGSINFIDPTYQPGFTGQGGLEGYNMFQQRSGDVSDVGLPEVPARIEQLSGQQFIRGTQGELQPLNDVLDRVIEQALISGDSAKAIAFDDFRKRPSRADALQMALQYARSPADQTLISAISSGERYVSPPPAGELQQVGPPADFLQEAYQEFRDSMSGGRLPTPDEMEASMAPPPPTALEEAKLKGIELQNKKFELEIANLTQKGDDDHIAATAKVNNANKSTDSKIAATTNTSNIATQTYEDSSSDSTSGGGPQQPGTTRMIGGPDGGIRDIDNEKVQQFLDTGNWKHYEGEANYGAGDKFNKAAAVEATWNQMSPAQKGLWGSSLSAFKDSIGDYKNADSMNAAVDNALVDSELTTVGYKNDEGYQTWLSMSGDLKHSSTRRQMYDYKSPEEWRKVLGLEEQKAKETGTATGATPGDAGYETEEGTPELYDTGTESIQTLQEANNEASVAVEKTVVATETDSQAIIDTAGGIDFPTAGAKMQAHLLSQGVVDPDEVLGVGDLWSDLLDTPQTGDQYKRGEATYGDFDPTIGPGDPGYSYAPFSMASGDQDDDAPGKSVRSENLRIEDFSSPIAHALAVKAARDKEEGVRYLRPGDEDYGTEMIRANLQEQTAARQQTKSEEVAKIIADQEYAASVEERNAAIRESLSNIPGAVEDARQSAIALGRDIADYDIPDPPSALEAMRMDIPNPPSLLSAVGSGLSALKGVTIDPIESRYQEIEEQKEAARDAPPVPKPGQRYPEDLAEGGKTSSDRMTLVGEEGPEIALFPDGTEIIPTKRKMKPSQAKRLKNRGVRGMAEGGLVFPGVDDIGEASGVDVSRYGGSLPSGVRRTIMGQSIAPSRGYLSRAAGITLPSGQAMRNMLPEEMDILKDVGAQTRIPERAFERELALGIPSGQRSRGSARLLPLSLR